MSNINRQVTQPLNVPRTNRNHNVTVLTSLPAGKCVPMAAIPLLREDAVSTGRVNIAFEMQETAEILMNPVNVRVSAYLVPFLAFERFEGSMDQFNRSYMGQPKVTGGAVVPFLETYGAAAHGGDTVLKYMGLHAKPGDLINSAYDEAYNLIWNFRAKNRSPDITPRTRLDTTLAPAFWQHSRFAHIVPDFDQAVIDGEVALSVVAGSALPIHGLGIERAHVPAAYVPPGGVVSASDGVRISTGSYPNLWSSSAQTNSGLAFALQAGAGGHLFPDIWAEMTGEGVTISLANIEMARRTQAFARLREQFAGHDDEWIIDMLMDGLTIPDQALKQPLLLAQQDTKFGMAKRYATDSGNLSESAVSGAAMASLSLRVPKLHTGGIIMIIAEITPEQLFERQKDWLFHSTSVDTWPEYLRDTLDPEKVVAVPNNFIDTSHGTPAATFGYAPLNHEFNVLAPRIGGKFFRPTVNTGFDEDRQRLWAVETVNPVLSEDFYICRNIHTKPFLDTVSDPFEATMLGNVVINGNTVFGPALIESGAVSNYDKVMEKAPVERIEKGV